MTRCLRVLLLIGMFCSCAASGADDLRAERLDRTPKALEPGMGYLLQTFDMPAETKAVRFSVHGKRSVLMTHSLLPKGKSAALWMVSAGNYCLEKFYSGRWRFSPNSSFMLCLTVKPGVMNHVGTLRWGYGRAEFGTAWEDAIRAVGDDYPWLFEQRIPWIMGQQTYADSRPGQRDYLKFAAPDAADRYRTGRGVPRDPERALYWAKLAALEGDARSAALVCQQLDLGRGVPVDAAGARPYCEQAAAAGDSLGAWFLARMHARGRGGLAPDRAVEQALLVKTGSVAELAELVFESTWGLQDDAGAYPDAGEAYRLADGWYRAGSARGAMYLAEFHRDGISVKPDAELAVDFFLKAAFGGLHIGWWRASDVYWDGKHGPRDEMKAVAYMDRYARKDKNTGLAEAAWRMSVATDPAARDPARALKLAEEAVETFGPTLPNLSALTAAHAANGAFDAAVKTQKQVIEALEEADEPDTAALAAAVERLRQYREGQVPRH